MDSPSALSSLSPDSPALTQPPATFLHKQLPAVSTPFLSVPSEVGKCDPQPSSPHLLPHEALQRQPDPQKNHQPAHHNHPGQLPMRTHPDQNAPMLFRQRKSSTSGSLQAPAHRSFQNRPDVSSRG